VFTRCRVYGISGFILYVIWILVFGIGVEHRARGAMWECLRSDPSHNATFCSFHFFGDMLVSPPKKSQPTLRCVCNYAINFIFFSCWTRRRGRKLLYPPDFSRVRGKVRFSFGSLHTRNGRCTTHARAWVGCVS